MHLGKKHYLHIHYSTYTSQTILRLRHGLDTGLGIENRVIKKIIIQCSFPRGVFILINFLRYNPVYTAVISVTEILSIAKFIIDEILSITILMTFTSLDFGASLLVPLLHGGWNMEPRSLPGLL